MDDLRAYAHCSWGRWVARCPRPGCPGAEHHGADPHTGHVGGLTGTGFRCAFCALVCPAEWPPNVDAITGMLSQRPVPSTRNWEVGQTLADLLAENLEHGIVPAGLRELAARPGGRLLQITGGEVLVDRLGLEPAP